jgi:uncharacterized protein (UPF0303 family)
MDKKPDIEVYKLEEDQEWIFMKDGKAVVCIIDSIIDGMVTVSINEDEHMMSVEALTDFLVEAGETCCRTDYEVSP